MRSIYGSMLPRRSAIASSASSRRHSCSARLTTAGASPSARTNARAPYSLSSTARSSSPGIAGIAPLRSIHVASSARAISQTRRGARQRAVSTTMVTALVAVSAHIEPGPTGSIISRPASTRTPGSSIHIRAPRVPTTRLMRNVVRSPRTARTRAISAGPIHTTAAWSCVTVTAPVVSLLPAGIAPGFGSSVAALTGNCTACGIHTSLRGTASATRTSASRNPSVTTQLALHRARSGRVMARSAHPGA